MDNTIMGIIEAADRDCGELSKLAKQAEVTARIIDRFGAQRVTDTVPATCITATWRCEYCERENYGAPTEPTGMAGDYIVRYNGGGVWDGV